VAEKWRQADELVREARQRGAANAEVLVVESSSVRVAMGDRVPRREVEQQACLRLWDEAGSVGTAIGGGDSGGVDLVGLALAMAAKGGAPAVPLAPRLDVPSRGMGILDPRQSGIDDEARVQVVTDALASCTGVDRAARVQEMTYEEVVQDRSFAASRGVALRERSTRYRLSTAVTGFGDGEHIIRGSTTSRNFAEVASKPLGIQVTRRALALRDRAKLPDAPLPVAFSQRAIADILPRIARGFRGEQVEGKRSFVGAWGGRTDRSPNLHILDDASLHGGYATRSFDDRGVPSIPVNLLREGEIGGLYQGIPAAHATQTRPSGHETWDGGLWMGNLVVRPGNRSRNMIFADLGPLVLVEDIVDARGVDSESGQIDVLALVHRYQTNERRGFCGVQRLRCSVSELFGGVTHLLNDQERWGIVDTPTWVVSGLWFEDA
jgi:predicted Zn-dependent protease